MGEVPAAVQEAAVLAEGTGAQAVGEAVGDARAEPLDGETGEAVVGVVGESGVGTRGVAWRTAAAC